MSTESETASDVTTRAERERQWEDEFLPQQHVYEPHKVGLPPLRAYLHEVWRRRAFAIELARTKLDAQHYGTVFGTAWLILNPLLLGCVYFLLIDILRGGHHAHGAFARLLGSIFLFYLMGDAVRPASKSVTSGGKLVLNSAFPRSLLPIASVLQSISRFWPTMVVFAVVHTISGLPVNLNLLWAIVVFVEVVVFTTGVSLTFAALQVYFRDFANFLPYLMRIWLYMSPILWVYSEVPHGYKFLLYVNPMGSMLTAWTECLWLGIQPGGRWLLLGAAWAVFSFVAGAAFFISRERDFAVRI
jgi:ABC-type polysaccharide/polyol phosphate export permease